MRRQLSHKCTLLLSRTTIPFVNKYSYTFFAYFTLTSKKLASDGYTFSTSGICSNTLINASRIPTNSLIILLTWSISSIASLARSCVAWLILYGGLILSSSVTISVEENVIPNLKAAKPQALLKVCITTRLGYSVNSSNNDLYREKLI